MLAGTAQYNPLDHHAPYTQKSTPLSCSRRQGSSLSEGGCADAEALPKS